MKNLIAIISIILLLTSCSPAKRLQNIYYRHPELAPKTQTDTYIKDSISTEISYRDTTIYVSIPGESSHDTVSIPCPEPPASYIADTAKAETSLASAKAYWDFPNVVLELTQKDTAIETRLKDAIRMENVYRMLYEREKKHTVTQVRHIPKIYNVAFWCWIVVIVFFALYIVWKIYKKL